MASGGKDVEKKEPLCTVGGNVNWYSHYGKQYRGSAKIKNITTIRSSNSTYGYLSQGNKITISKRYLHAPVH